MAAGFPAKGTGGTLFVNGNALPASDLNDLGGTLNLIAPTAKGDLFAGSAANTYTKLSVGTDGQVLTADSASTDGMKWANSTAGQNVILNADFLINQRNFTSNTATGLFNFDRWLQQNSGGTCTVTPQTFTPGAAPIAGVEGNTYVQLVTATQSAAGDYGILTQRIEDVRKFAGQTIVVSFYAKAGSGTPSIGVEIQQNFGSGGSPSATVSTPIAAKAITTSWVRYSASVAVPSISGKTIGTTANTSYLELNLWISSGATNATRASSIGIQNNTFSIWGVKVETGTVPTAFSTKTQDFAGELIACQRYYYRQPATAALDYLASGYVSSSIRADGVYQLPTVMRSSPVLGNSGTLAHYSVVASAGTTVCSVLPVLAATSSVQKMSIQFQVAGGLTAGQGCVLVLSNASAYLDFTAEL